VSSHPVLLGGAFIGVLSALPFVSVANCCCLWIIGGGAIAAYLLQQEQAAPIAASDGARVGFLAGVVGAVVYVVVAVPVQLVMAPLERRMRERLLDSAADVPPQIRELLDRFGGLADEQGVIAGLVVGFVVMLVGGMVFATLGGALGAALFRRQPPPAPDASDVPLPPT